MTNKQNNCNDNDDLNIAGKLARNFIEHPLTLIFAIFIMIVGYMALNLTLGQFISIIFLILGGILFFYKKNEN